MQLIIGDKMIAMPAVLRSLTVAAGLMSAAIVSGCSTPAHNDTFDLSGATAPADSRAAARGKQILVPPPTALKALDSENILVRLSASEIQYLANAQWGDSLTRMVQSKLVEAFENSGKLGGVGVPGQGLAIDYQIASDIRAFEVQTSGGTRANVEISVKVVNDRNGTVRAQQVFSASVPVSGVGNAAFVKGLDKAFGSVSGQIVSWTLGVI